jgi:ferritin-like protein
MSHEGFHEAIEKLTPATLDMHRAIESLMEEMEAVDWYNQRIDACENDELKQILLHNRDEEKEHAVMIIEWLRRNDPYFEDQLKKRLNKAGPIAHAKKVGDK